MTDNYCRCRVFIRSVEDLANCRSLSWRANSTTAPGPRWILFCLRATSPRPTRSFLCRQCPSETTLTDRWSDAHVLCNQEGFQRVHTAQKSGKLWTRCFNYFDLVNIFVQFPSVLWRRWLVEACKNNLCRRRKSCGLPTDEVQLIYSGMCSTL